jgi:Fe2+ or Zn2+ uptake regulation protein
MHIFSPIYNGENLYIKVSLIFHQVKKLEEKKMKRGPKTFFDSILKFWKKHNTALSFNTIAELAEEKGISKRTLINYLNRLVKEGVLEKIVDENRNTYYRLAQTDASLTRWLKAQIKESIEDIEILVSPNEIAVLGILAFLTNLFIFEIMSADAKSFQEIIKIFEKTVNETLVALVSINNPEELKKLIEPLVYLY